MDGDLTQSQICYLRAINGSHKAEEVLQLEVSQTRLENTKEIEEIQIAKYLEQVIIKMSSSYCDEYKEALIRPLREYINVFS